MQRKFNETLCKVKEQSVPATVQALVVARETAYSDAVDSTAAAWFPGLYSSRSRGPNHMRPGKKCSLVPNLSSKLTPSQPTSLRQPTRWTFN